MYVKNRQVLVDHGNRVLRRAALDIAEYVLDRVNPYRLTMEVVSLDGDTLHIGEGSFDLRNRGDIYVLGAGKASLPIVQALEDILGDRIRHGLLTVKEGQTTGTRIVETREASHPLPDVRGFKAAEDTLRLAAQTKAQDIVFCAITGGSSALWPCPIVGLGIEGKREVHRLLLESGASIREINAVRKHLSRIKGGRLAAAIMPATVINLTVSDVTGDPYDYITGPTVPDTSTFDDARAVLDKYALWERMPAAAAEHLRNGTPDMENPQHFPDDAIHTFLLVPSDMVCTAAAEKAHELGFNPHILTCEMEGDSQTEGRRFGAALSLAQQANEMDALAVIAGGETTVSIRANVGAGGPNQEFGLAAACALSGDEQTVLSLDTDGTDGPTDAAGAFADHTTIDRARAIGLDPARHLVDNNAYPFFKQLDDLLITGPTGTNVMDMRIVMVGRARRTRR